MSDAYDNAEPSMADSLGKLILRVTLGVLMLFHGIPKIANPGAMEFIKGKLAELNPNIPPEVAYGVYLGEVVAPVLLILGIFARFGGLLVAGNMVFAIALVHMGQLLMRNEATGGWELELQAFFLFCGLAVLFLGSGRIAVRPD